MIATQNSQRRSDKVLRHAPERTRRNRTHAKKPQFRFADFVVSPWV
jgi:hypothetical protein